MLKNTFLFGWGAKKALTLHRHLKQSPLARGREKVKNTKVLR